MVNEGLFLHFLPLYRCVSEYVTRNAGSQFFVEPGGTFDERKVRINSALRSGAENASTSWILLPLPVLRVRQDLRLNNTRE